MEALERALKDKSEQIQKHLNEVIPGYMHGAIMRYLWDGVQPGDFLSAIISNDLRNAVAMADNTNRQLIPDYVEIFRWHMPSQCWGSSEKMAEWKGWHHILKEAGEAIARGET